MAIADTLKDQPFRIAWLRESSNPSRVDAVRWITGYTWSRRRIGQRRLVLDEGKVHPNRLQLQPNIQGLSKQHRYCGSNSSQQPAASSSKIVTLCACTCRAPSTFIRILLQPLSKAASSLSFLIFVSIFGLPLIPGGYPQRNTTLHSTSALSVCLSLSPLPLCLSDWKKPKKAQIYPGTGSGALFQRQSETQSWTLSGMPAQLSCTHFQSRRYQMKLSTSPIRKAH
jgi:hypothetical protein